MPRGGRRSGKPGKNYSNRSDLAQAPRAAGGQEYGKRGQQIAAQKAMPLPSMPGPPRSDPTPMHAGTQRPTEPITAGLPIGAGPGPQANPVALDPLEELQAIFQQYPNDDLAEMLANARPAKRLNSQRWAPWGTDMPRNFPGQHHNDGMDGTWSKSGRGPTTDLYDPDTGTPLVEPIPGRGAGRDVGPPGGTVEPRPGRDALGRGRATPA